MDKWLWKYRSPILQALGFVLVLNGLLTYNEVIFILPPFGGPKALALFTANLLWLLGLWAVVAAAIHKFSLVKVFGVISLLLVAIIAEYNIHISQNLFTTPLLILFWLGVGYFVIPQFFNKYRKIILITYGLLIAYFLFDFSITKGYSGEDRKAFANWMIVPIPVLIALWLYEQWRWVTALKTGKAEAELALLKSQVNPHFFFNTLNNLYGLVVTKSPEAPDVVLKLSEMMRYTIYKGKEATVGLLDEIEYLKAYIDLHKIRYQHQVDIQFEYDVDESIQVAPLLFIILLENAFKHGVQGLGDEAYIHLSLRIHGNALLFTIKNNFDPEAQLPQKGIGLHNLQQRLQHIYPNQHTLDIQVDEASYTAQLHLDL